MDLLLIILFVIALYWRTMDYSYLIDDIVRRWGFLLEIPETSPPPEFFNAKPPKTKHLFLTLMQCVNVSVIYFLWGWKAALLFAVFPFSVSCTAWITGGYYQVTTFLTLIAYFFLVKFTGIAGAGLGALFFTAALGSTINCLTIPFLFLFFPPFTGLALFWPLAFYLTGHRFNVGFGIRNRGKSDQITIKKLVVVPKVLAYYIKNMVWPEKLAFFREYGFEYGKNPKVKIDLESINREFFESIAICLAFIVIGGILSPFGTAWFIFTIMPFTQWKVLGQFVAERYLYLPMIGYILILSNLFSFHPLMLIPMAIVVGLYAWRSHTYIPAFQNIETLYENGTRQYPNCISNFVNLAERKLHTGRLFDAYKLLKHGLEMDPQSFLCHANMAAYWLAINKPEMGMYHTKMALQYADNRGMAYLIFKNQINNINGGIAKMKEFNAEIEKIIEEIRQEESVDKSPMEDSNVSKIV